jgi:hypothetical protein
MSASTISYERNTLHEQRKIYWARRSSSNDLAPMVGNKRKKDETEKTEQDTDANETQGTLYGFRGV